MRALVITLLSACLPATALACGGLFCNNQTPVLQAAERILFAPEGDQMNMIVRLTWDGPPIEFGWLLPVPGDVETWVGSEYMFQLIDVYQPDAHIETEYVGDCAAWEDSRALGGSGGGGGDEAGNWDDDGDGVLLVSREPVGPYDRVVLRADTVEGLVTWLRDNGFQVPEGAEPTLEPYLRLGLAFVALKLLPGADSSDVVPLHLRFTGQTPGIPLMPTAVAATPDMAIVVNLLGPARAVATNVPHVTIDPAAIDWLGQGFRTSYPHVLAQAVDEAGGRAVVTEYAGPPPGRHWLAEVDAEMLAQIEAVQTTARLARLIDQLPRDDDVRRTVRDAVPIPAGVDPNEFLSCMACFPAVPVDGPALAAALRERVNAPRARIAPLFDAPWLTRLRTTMSPDEMDRDPMFAFNADLPEVSRVYRLTQYTPCRDGWPSDREAVYQLDDGRRLIPGGQAIVRQGGETVRGVGQRAALRIEQHFLAGQPEVIEDYTDAPPGPTDPWTYAGEPFPELSRGGAGGASGGGNRDRPTDAHPMASDADEGCACRADSDAPTNAPFAVLGLLTLLGLRRRRGSVPTRPS